LLLLLSFTGGGHVAVASADTQPSAIHAELRYLERAENPDGGFGSGLHEPSAQLFTAWAVIGIAAAGGNPTAGATWIESHLSSLQGPGDLERTILALSAAHAPLHHLVSELQHDQSVDGSFNDQANLTAFGILALRAAHASDIPTATTWLRRQQNRDGGFSFAQRGSPSDVDDTAAAVEALVGRASVTRAISYLRHARNPDGGFPEQPGDTSNAQSTAWVIQAFLAAGSPPTGAAYLERLTAPSGAVSYSSGVSQTPVWVTSETLAALTGRPLPIENWRHQARMRSVWQYRRRSRNAGGSGRSVQTRRRA
jgi:hypothetical protein